MTTKKPSINIINKLIIGTLCFAGFVFFIYLSLKFCDTDLYYIIPTGRYILKNGIPYENPFITTPGQNIVIQNWLYCAIVALMYNTAHSMGLWFLQIFSIIIMVTVIAFFFHLKESHNKIITCIFIAISISTFSYINLRPEMLTFILIMIEILSIEKYNATIRLDIYGCFQ